MMHAIVIAYLVCLVPILVSSVPADDDYSSSSSDYQSSVDDGPYLPMKVFALNDRNNDGVITLKEYKKSNPDISDAEARTIFTSFDMDRNGRISLNEFAARVQHDAPERKEDCLASIMKTCSAEFIDAVQRWGDKQGDPMCHCLPVYRDCIEYERVACSTKSPNGDQDEEGILKSQVDALLRRFRKSLCQDAFSSRIRPSAVAVYSTNGPTAMTSDYIPRGIRQVRSARRDSKRFKSRARRQSCIVSTMRPCNNVFVAALQAQEEDPCNSLVKYRHCVHKSTRRCSDPNIPHIQRAIKFLTKEHRRVKICGKFEP